MDDSTTFLTARQSGLVSCQFCNTLSKLPEQAPLEKKELHCPCCQSVIHSRIPDSLGKTWALLIAAIILYIPANIMPIMTLIIWGDGQPDTILSGVIHLFDAGLWPLALLIFYRQYTYTRIKVIDTNEFII